MTSRKDKKDSIIPVSYKKSVSIDDMVQDDENHANKDYDDNEKYHVDDNGKKSVVTLIIICTYPHTKLVSADITDTDRYYYQGCLSICKINWLNNFSVLWELIVFPSKETQSGIGNTAGNKVVFSSKFVE